VSTTIQMQVKKQMYGSLGLASSDVTVGTCSFVTKYLESQ